MSPERWKQVQALFHTALSHEPEQRGKVLSDLCSTDPDLREEVASLLRSHEEGDEFLETPAFDARAAVAQVTPAGAGDLAGTVIEQYQVESMLGAGGMGEVYRAKDRRVGRDV